jgi:hypothetical protein
VRHLTLVAPYLAYMRQDIAFHPGEAVSQRIVGPFLASLFDAVVTVDPHLHRVATLQEARPCPQARPCSAARRCWPTGSCSSAPARCWWAPMANRPSGWPRPPRATA